MYLFMFGLLAEYIALFDARQEDYAFAAFMAGTPFLLMKFPARLRICLVLFMIFAVVAIEFAEYPLMTHLISQCVTFLRVG